MVPVNRVPHPSGVAPCSIQVIDTWTDPHLSDGEYFTLTRFWSATPYIPLLKNSASLPQNAIIQHKMCLRQLYPTVVRLSTP